MLLASCLRGHLLIETIRGHTSHALIKPRQSCVSGKKVVHCICIIFFGRPDNRETLKLTGRMAEHPGAGRHAVH
uniref:Uncharacterized protein n=1 Tax=Oryza meridionalis TaxID=40149 RepID=A0A0E0C9T7_9ORYZ